MKNVYPFITSNTNLQDTMLFLGAVVTQTCSISLVCPSNFCALLLQYYCFISWLSRLKDPKLKYFFIGITKIVIFFLSPVVVFLSEHIETKGHQKRSIKPTLCKYNYHYPKTIFCQILTDENS